jgi:decaprenylphospho-beta-D-erythro-pentofuranosid-2-ulose 2-reductase
MKKILVIGATSAIAQAAERLWANEGCDCFLIARNEENLQTVADDLRARGANAVRTARLDANDFALHEAVIQNAFEALGSVDIVLIAHGMLPDQKTCEQDVGATLDALTTNGTSVIALLTIIANYMERQKHGTIAAVTSVAGDRGRQSNYVYGASKKLVSTFLEGLAHRLYKSNVKVIDIRPGFVDTPMTAAIVGKGALWSSPEVIGVRIFEAVSGGKQGTIYAPSYWRFILFVIRALPRFLFQRTNI